MKRYPFSPAVLDALPEPLAELFRGLEDKLLAEICKRLKAADQLNEVTVQDIRALRAHGIDLKSIRKAIREVSGIGEQELNKLLDDVVARNQAYHTEQIDLAGVTKPEQIVSPEDIEAIRTQTVEEFRNITQSLAFLTDNGQTMLPPAKAYQWALDQAALQVESGAVNYNDAIRGAVRQLAESGIKTAVYESGHIDQIDVAARRAVMTGINQLCARYNEQSAEYLDTPYYEVSAHSGARDEPGRSPWASHKDWQGKVYSVRHGDKYPNIYDVCGLGAVDGLEGANCRHIRNPFVEGVSERTYTDEQLAHIDDGLGCTYDGKTYSAYQATQMQRRIERTIRKQKRLRDAYKAAGLEDDARTANIKLRRLNAKYREFSNAAKLPEQPERTKVLYTDAKSEAEAAAKLQQKGLTSGGKSVTIQSGIDAPIDARNSSVGKPNAVSIFGAKLSKRQTELLANLPGDNSRVTVRKRGVNMKDLAALTAQTGDEFAMFTKGGERLIVRGNHMRVNIHEEESAQMAAAGYRWSGHTHPGADELTKTASDGDYKILKAFGQEQSVIYDSLGRHQNFGR